jgi:hypothetical protein
VVPHLLGHVVLLAVVVQMLRTQLLGSGAPGLTSPQVTCQASLHAVVPYIALGGSSSAMLHALIAIASPAAAANRPTARPKALISITFSSFGAHLWELAKEKALASS